jgi:hypothetical protein
MALARAEEVGRGRWQPQRLTTEEDRRTRTTEEDWGGGGPAAGGSIRWSGGRSGRRWQGTVYGQHGHYEWVGRRVEARSCGG